MINTKLENGLRLALVLVILTIFHSQAQITIDTSFTAERLVKKILIGNGVLVGTVSYQGPKHAIAYFRDPDFNVHLEEGIILTTGNAFFVKGPNRVPDRGWASGTTGDEDLDLLSAGKTHDAAILEFDFVTSSEYLSFNFTFGSEEYLEYVGSKYNDVFGFFIDGPGLNHVNLAVLPQTGEPITVNNINHKKNKKFYHDNGYQNTSQPYIWDNRKKKPVRNKRYGKTPKKSPYNVQFDGFTQVLEARCMVVPNEIYHIKLAIADVSDYILDSGVFLEAGSFRSFGDQLVVWDNPFEPVQNKDSERPAVDLMVHLVAPKAEHLTSPGLPDPPATITGLERKWYNIQFEFNSFDITPAHSRQLEKLSDLVDDNPRAVVKIIGHTDNVGSAAYNDKLSAQRSMAVTNYLLDQGVESSRIKTLYYGETQPIHANSTAYGRTQNRRVEFILEFEPELNTANYSKPNLVEN
ncbi:MAG: OmpA family protein [Bacteroidetes bacterium]|nr:MAG: OmpA family protein [Bacteroidota bacterium]